MTQTWNLWWFTSSTAHTSRSSHGLHVNNALSLRFQQALTQSLTNSLSGKFLSCFTCIQSWAGMKKMFNSVHSEALKIRSVLKAQRDFHIKRVKNLRINSIRSRCKPAAPAFLLHTHTHTHAHKNTETSNGPVSTYPCFYFWAILLKWTLDIVFWSGSNAMPEPAPILQSFFPTPAPTPMDLSAVSIISNIIPPLSRSFFFMFSQGCTNNE